ncbi:VOC family protein [Ohessyouella blattaphilus]|uniref:Glyoxalase-like domain-containing protein n=1 Tax=Ohessyouella blattaphilus TaxID=2949333 RepID=A0ABT1EFQ3_9FIRM|nr:VOC family protein [Ohessyouella blattaphilus]MCP1109537.1 hypothetical protein [Ohessyouella blattaphilus]MCR8562931.1 hypothetical protein [Ohessyouella blattaphilus]
MRLGAIVLDSDNIDALSDFYAKLLGWKMNVQMHDGEKWITVIKDDFSETPLVFQENPDYRKPVWPPTKTEQQQMVHLDFYVKADEFEAKIAYAIECGATMAENQLSSDWKVMLDVSGHPFCIIPIPKEVYEQRYGANN